MIYRDIHETSYGRTIDVGKLKTALRFYEARSEHSPSVEFPDGVFDDVTCRFITGKHGAAKDVPIFNHPYVSEFGMLYVDIRPFIVEEYDGLKVRNTSGVEFSRTRGMLTSMWLSEQQVDMKVSTVLATKVYVEILGNLISSRFGADVRDSFIIKTLLGCFYLQLFRASDKLDDEDKTIILSNLRSYLGFPASEMADIVEACSPMNRIEDVIAEIIKQTESVRLSKLTTNVFMTALGAVWFGHMAKEVMAIALEHPPTWIAMVEQGYSNRSHKRSLLGKATNQDYRRFRGDDMKSYLTQQKKEWSPGWK